MLIGSNSNLLLVIWFVTERLWKFRWSVKCIGDEAKACKSFYVSVDGQ